MAIMDILPDLHCLPCLLNLTPLTTIASSFPYRKSCIFFRLYGVHGRLSFFSGRFLCCPRSTLSTTLGWGLTTSTPANDGHGDDSDSVTTQMWYYRACLRELRFQILGWLTNEYSVDMWQ